MKKKGVVADYLPWIIIGIAVLAVVLATSFILKNQGIDLIEKIRGLFG